MIRIDWFLKKVMCAVFHCLNSFVNRTEGRHDDDGHVRVRGTSGAQHVQSRAVWHTQVSQDKAMTRLRDFVEGSASVIRLRHAVTGIFESKSQYATQAVFVFDK